MKGLLFLGIIVVLLFVAFMSTQKEVEKEVTKEKFTDCPTTSVKVPSVKVKPMMLDGSSPAAYLPPVETVYGPAFGEIARVASLPYKDPTAEAAPLKRINEVLVSIDGFMNFEAKSLEEQSDPAVQLPLTTARGDQQRLGDEVSVLKRNPGIDSSITQGQLDDIQANLNYLQKKQRTLVNAASTASTEGFEDKDPSDRITFVELKEISVAINVEIIRLSSSGTTDPVTQKRINSLGKMKNDVNDLINKVESGAMSEKDIPILKTDKGKFLPLMSDTSKPLNKLIDEAKLPPSLANLFPSFQSGDITAGEVAQKLFENYGNSISWGLNLKFTSPNEVAAANSTVTSRLGKAATAADVPNIDVESSDLSNSSTSYNATPYDKINSDYSRGELEQATNSIDDQRADLKRNGLGPTTKTAHLNWKERSSAICENIRKAGMNPKDFGCLDTNVKVGRDYSWRGNARMVCTRLLSTPDPGLPEACGCPPVEWRGWKA